MGTFTRQSAQAFALASIREARRNRMAKRGTLSEKVDRNRQVVAMRLSGATQREIASAFGITRTMVAKILEREGTPPIRKRMIWTDEMVTTLRASRESGLSIEKTAQRVGVGFRQAWAKSRELGLSAPAHRISDEG